MELQHNQPLQFGSDMEEVEILLTNGLREQRDVEERSGCYYYYYWLLLVITIGIWLLVLLTRDLVKLNLQRSANRPLSNVDAL